MLDDLKLIHDRDPNDALGIAERSYRQLELDFNLDPSDFSPENIVYAGMGGSALAAFLSTTWPGYSLPFEISRNYVLPKYVNQKTLVILSSYSGNTEETLECMKQAEQSGSKIYVISHGGQISDVAREKGWPLLEIPDTNQPRYSVFAQLKAIVAILAANSLVDSEEVRNSLENTSKFLASKAETLRANVPEKDNIAKKIALNAAGKSVVVYSGPLLAPAAYKWKISFNENAKQVAWWNTYPEFNHNEFIGWTNQPPLKPYCVIDLISNLENPRIKLRMDLSAKLLSGKRPEPFKVEIEGDNLLDQLLYAVMLGDFTSIYSAILSGVEPVSVDIIEKLKGELKDE